MGGLTIEQLVLLLVLIGVPLLRALFRRSQAQPPMPVGEPVADARTPPARPEAAPAAQIPPARIAARLRPLAQPAEVAAPSPARPAGLRLFRSPSRRTIRAAVLWKTVLDPPAGL